MSAKSKSESSVLEQLKELVKANGNQAAAILDAVIEVLSQGGGGGGTVIPGDKGQLLISDGQGGLSADENLFIDENGRATSANGINVSGVAVFDDKLLVSQKDARFGGKGIATGLILYDTANPTVAYRVTIANGQLTATQMP